MRRPSSRRTLLILLLCACSTATAAADLTANASRAYADYLARARDAFVDRATREGELLDADSRAALRNGAVLGKPGQGDGIHTVQDALVHHWVGAVFIERATLEQVLATSRAYQDYPAMFEPIVAARVLENDGDVFRLLTRLRESAGGISATLDVRSTARYVRLNQRRAYVVSSSDEIREVRDAGRPTETLMPPGRDNGYLWRASTFTHFVERDGGVYVEIETVGLSRRFPPMLGWLIEPIARRLGRKSVAESADEFRAAVRKRMTA